jgi:hypothetical protein
MANRYWRGGTGTWNSTNTANWSTTDGGAGGASVPTSADNVYFTGNSGAGTCTTSGTVNCGALYFASHSLTNYTGTFAGSSAVNVNGDFGISPSMTWTHSGIIGIGGSGGRIVYPNGKTISSTLSRNMTSGTLTMAGAFTTTNLFRGISGTAGDWDLGTFTHTAGRFDFSQYGSGNTLKFGTGAKLVASNSGNLTVLTTASGFLFLTTGTPNFELLTPPAGITNTFQVFARTDVANNFNVTIIPSGTGTVTFGTNATNNGPRTVTINAGGAYTLQSCFATDSITFNSGFTGTAGTGVAGGSFLCGWPVAAGGCTITMNGIHWAGTFGYSGSTANTNPIILNGNLSCESFYCNNFTYNLNGYGLIAKPVSTIVTQAAITVDAIVNTILNFGSSSGYLQVEPTANSQYFLYFNGNNVSRFTMNNRQELRLKATNFSTLSDVAITAGAMPAAKRFNIRILTGTVTVPSGTNTVNFSNSTAATPGAYINDLIIENVSIYLVGTVTMSGNLTGPASVTNNPIVAMGNIYFDSGATQTITSGAMQWRTPLRMDVANTILSLGDNFNAYDFGTSASGNVALYMGRGLLQLNSYTFKCQEINFGSFVDQAGSGISFGTGKLRFFRQGGGACISGSPPATISLGTWSGSRMVELEVPSTGQTINLPDVLNQLELNVTIVAGSTGGSVAIGGCTDLIVNASPGNTVGTFVTYVGRNLTLNADLYTSTNMFFQGGGYRGASVDGTWISNGYAINVTSTAVLYFNKVSNTITLGSAATINGPASLIWGTLALSSYSLTVSGTFATGTSGTDLKVLNFGTGSITLNGSGTYTALNLDATGYGTATTLSGTSRQIYVTTPGSGATKTLTVDFASATKALDFETISVGSGGTVAFGNSSTGVRNLTIAGGTYTLNKNNALTIYGDLNVNGNITGYGGSSTTFSGTSGTQIVNTNGFTFGRSAETITFNSTGASFQLNGNSVFASATVHAGGTLNLNNFRLTVLSFNGSNSAVRTINFQTSGAIRLTGSGTVWNTSTNTNLTVSGTNRFVEPNLNAAQTVSFGTPTEANTFDVSVPSTASNFTLTFIAGNNVRSVTFANVAYTVANITLNIYGDLSILGTTPTFTSGSNIWTFAATSGSKTITTNGELIEFPFTINSPGATYSLGSALSTTQTLTLTAGTFNANNYNVSANTFSSSNSNVRSLTMGNGNWTLASSTSTWNVATGTNMTLTRGTGEIIMPATGGGSFAGGGQTYPKIRFRGVGTYTFSGTNTRFADLIRDPAVVTSFTLSFTSAETFLFDDFTIKGVSAVVQLNITANSTTQHILSKSSGIVNSDFLNITRSNATGGAGWYAGANSTNGGNNTGWIFTAAPSNSGNMFMLFR